MSSLNLPEDADYDTLGGFPSSRPRPSGCTMSAVRGLARFFWKYDETRFFSSRALPT